MLPVDKRATAPSHDVSPGYFKTWGIPVLAGRDFDEHDTADHQNVVLISQSGAKKVFGNENPIGKTLLGHEFRHAVRDRRHRRRRSLAKGSTRLTTWNFIVPWAQENFPFPTIVVRSNLREDAVTKLVRSTLATVDPGLAIALPQSMDKIVAQALGQARLMTWLLGIFAGIALLLASNRDLWRSGIHGRTTHWRDRRAHGARCANPRRAAFGCEPGNETSGYWAGDWNCVGIRDWPFADIAALRSFGAQSGAACGFSGFARGDCIDCMSGSRAASRAR